MEKQKLPNGTLILILGIISIITCCCYGIIGLICGIIAIVLASSATKTYQLNPELYTGYGNVKAGKIMAIIGIILNVIFVAYLVWIFSMIGWDAITDPESLQQKILEMQQGTY